MTDKPCTGCNATDHASLAHTDLTECHRQVVREIARARRQLTAVERWAGILRDLGVRDGAKARGETP